MQTDDVLIEGVLVCSNPRCLREFPVLDGIPILVADLRTYISQNLIPVLGRQDLCATLESLVGDCLGPGSAFDAQRQHLSTYAYDHYGELDPGRPDNQPAPGSALELLQQGLAASGEMGAGPVIDLGCAVGRTSFELARSVDGPVLGIDLNFGMLRVGASILAGRGARYPMRRVGLVYDRRDLEASFPKAERVDFWACDAACLPLAESCAAHAVSLNVIDCVTSPYDHLQELSRVLRPGGTAILSTPYDWSASATPVEAWLGGHSQRSETHGHSDAVLRSLLAGGGHPNAIEALELVSELRELPWQLRLHDRSQMQYAVHMMILRKRTSSEP